MRLLFLFSLLGSLMLPHIAAADSPGFHFPLVKKHGGVASLPEAAQQPRQGAKIVFDITVDSKPDEVNRGLEDVARYLNLNAMAGHSPADVKLALVMHGGATRCALNDEAYASLTNVSHNPNLVLLQELKKHGVELYVCGQSLARSDFALADTARDVTVAASAMTVNVNKQLDGFSYLAIH